MIKRSIPPQRGFFPQPVYLMGCYKEDGRPNFTLKTWVTFCSTEPPTMMFTAGSAERKLTASRIMETGVFSANLVTEAMLPLADYCGAVSGRAADKCADMSVSWSHGVVLDVPVLDESPWVYECRVVDLKRIGNGTVFFGEIANIIVDERIPDVGYGRIGLAQFRPAIYAPGHYYQVGAPLGAVGQMGRPAGQTG